MGRKMLSGTFTKRFQTLKSKVLGKQHKCELLACVGVLATVETTAMWGDHGDVGPGQRVTEGADPP